MKKTFAERIRLMNQMYKLDVQDAPLLPHDAFDRLNDFQCTLEDEVGEIDDIVSRLDMDEELEPEDEIDVLVAIADLLADVTVYCRSEALKYGIPLEEVLEIVMDSNESKLDVDGQPIYNQHGKFLKGPNYWKPEGTIKELLLARMNKSELNALPTLPEPNIYRYLEPHEYNNANTVSFDVLLWDTIDELWDDGGWAGSDKTCIYCTSLTPEEFRALNSHIPQP